MEDVKATTFRKHLFEILDLAIHGEQVGISYKGSRVTLSMPLGESKLARAVRRNALLVDPEGIVSSDAGLMGEFEHAWAESDKTL
jgi:antitoxin (DNA-binding transcriptional repressor) of toxin-antitoxin stability system